MNRRHVPWLIAGGCLLLCAALIFIITIGLLFSSRLGIIGNGRAGQTISPNAAATQVAVPSATSSNPTQSDTPKPGQTTQAPSESDQVAQVPVAQIPSGSFNALYQQLYPGVVNVQVFSQSAGEGAGSGFAYDKQGHIITNNHVIAGAGRVTVTFYNGFEAEAQVIGADAYSDLAVLQVQDVPEGVHPLPLGDSAQVRPGEWVIAIGNPFALGGSMTVGIVSAVGRTISSGMTSFDIPEAIQTDAAINPGNSGGPLLNMRGQVIGVNAQIATGGAAAANAGVGFAIPTHVVNHVIPTLVSKGSFQWPWLGVRGNNIDLFITQANHLENQQGAYIHYVDPQGPAGQAGLQGSTGTQSIDGLNVPVGGDIIIAADGKPIKDFTDLLVTVAFHSPNDTIQLTVIRGGQQRAITATLAPRPSSPIP